MRARVMTAVILAALGSLNRPARAQDTVTVATPPAGGTLDITSRAARDAVDRFNAPGTRRFLSGTTRIGADERIGGNVGAFAGRLELAGVVSGDVIAINADVDLASTAIIRGDLIVLGGTVTYPDRDLRIDGSVTVYRSRVLVTERGERLQLLRGERQGRRTRRRYRDTDASIRLSLGRTYNRVEGLPIHVGPRFEWTYGRAARVRLEALGILRTAGDFESERRDLGYTAGLEVRLGANESFTIQGRVYDVVAPIEAWQLTDEEVGLAAFLWHRDYRDYFLQRGISGQIGFHPSPDVSLEFGVARNEETSIAARDPWTPFRGDDPWRANPTIDEGHFTSIRARALYDTRPSHSSRRSGWRLSAEWERGISDDILPRALPITVRDPIAGQDLTFDRVFIDLRRYERLGRSGQLAVRAVGAGVVGEGPLPVQRRLSLGGPDPLPGFPFRRFACTETLIDPAIPALCDRLLLFQFEYRGDLSFGGLWDPWNDHDVHDSRRSWDRDWDDWAWFDGPEIVLFADAGTVWLDRDELDDFEGDVGVGLEFGSVGVYAAKAVTEDRSLRFALRIHRRF